MASALRLARLGPERQDRDRCPPVLESYRPRYAPVAELAGLGDAFAAAGDLDVVERLRRLGMSDFYGTSGQDGRARVRADERGRVRAQDRPAPGLLGVLRRGRRARLAGAPARVHAAADATATGSSATRMAPRSRSTPRRSACGHRSRPCGDPQAIRAHRDAYCAGIREYNARGPSAGGVDRPVPDPPFRVPHARPRLGDGGPRPLRRSLKRPTTRSGMARRAWQATA